MKKIFETSFFEKVYDQYGAVMYGCIIQVLKNKKNADTVLLTAFKEIAENIGYYQAAEAGVQRFLKLALQKSFEFLKANECAGVFKERSEEFAGYGKVAGISF